jgi:hypothetical protein
MQIHQTIGKVRSALEIYASRHHLLGADESLTCWCAIGSSVLKRILKEKHNLNPKFVRGACLNGNHCWIELEEYAIDITASQFFNQKVKIFKTKKYNKDEYDPIEVLENEYKLDWGDQAPKPKHLKAVKAILKTLS